MTCLVRLVRERIAGGCDNGGDDGDLKVKHSPKAAVTAVNSGNRTTVRRLKNRIRRARRVGRPDPALHPPRELQRLSRLNF